MYSVELLPAIMTPLVNKFYDAQKARGRAAKHDNVWVVKDNSKIIAACRLQPVDGYWLLVGVYVAPQFRRKGVAKKLIESAVYHFRSVNPGQTVYTFAYRHLCHFYTALGFQNNSCQLPSELASRLSSYLGQNRQLVAMYYV
ncbi:MULTISPECIES: GNAT family N-acetyltransferase [Pseudoalteromonas]|uniref:GNAT family N-acetyltransferase n=2 Tax=Pseudoalteromonas TaxID=53246 RepID=UPI000C7DB9D2|nr:MULTISPECIES: GNAT family N-acetyltransferase [Pseudoalteromonas]MCF7526756.1 GNAT family N-acetyltransferase [Pseudoalteromonas sp. L23]AUJ69109.1 Acetyltransferase (GNAT) family protein [Pseudoalteromonas sp. NC201]MBR8842075.1 GNAT family N-acetyltransferase [Pseudoalteromonas sp. JC3]MCF2829561.1 GNAT family N-acetyltransferase [Pseudoalteromonas sp. OF5H-5]MCF2927178.1 GNAT family N-acetyltransferase [Pseudoalteromonas sp. DL2-H1]